MSTSKPFCRTSFEFRTPRLVIRTPTAADEEEYYTLSTKPENYPHEEAEAGLTRETIREFIKNMPNYSSAGAAVFLLIELQETSEIIGLCSYNSFTSREPSEFLSRPGAISGPLWQTDIGLTIDHKHWRKGYGVETFCSMIEYAHQKLGCELFRAETGLTNRPWEKMMEKVGLSAFKMSDKSSVDTGKEAWAWRFGAEDWAEARRAMVEVRNWPLSSS